MAALVFKVGALALKTLAKPLGDRFKNWVMMHPQYRQNVLRAAQVGNRLFTLPKVSLHTPSMHTLCRCSCVHLA